MGLDPGGGDVETLIVQRCSSVIRTPHTCKFQTKWFVLFSSASRRIRRNAVADDECELVLCVIKLHAP